MLNFICITINGQQLRINHIVQYKKITEGLRGKHSGKLQVHTFSNAQIVCESSVIFSECNEIISSFSNGFNVTPKQVRGPICLQILGNVLIILPPSRIACFLQEVIQGTILKSSHLFFPIFGFFVEGFLSSTKLDQIINLLSKGRDILQIFFVLGCTRLWQ